MSGAGGGGYRGGIGRLAGDGNGGSSFITNIATQSQSLYSPHRTTLPPRNNDLDYINGVGVG